ncbi:permease [Desulfuromonas versatilis]|uniref:Permease n=1 Tax=Desulfuromonas versatilis TaxID=2802975 RepID=A0ABM8HRC4_9BACT|nr:DMT family transporter [Desulfuromonas versatilis]BCR04472.1 permease [Desulfuromonas versatilis]
MNQRLLGVTYVALSATGFGAMAIFARVAYAAGVDVATMLFLRFAIAAALLAAIMLRRGRRWPRGRNLLVLLLMGGVCYVGQSFCFFSALNHASAGLTALLLYLYPAIVTLIVAVISRRRLGPARIAAVLAALAGTALTVGGTPQGNALGVMLGIAAALIYSIYVVAGERVMGEEGALPSATVVMLAAALVYGLSVFARGPAWPTAPEGWAAIGALALFCTVVGILGFFAGIRRLGAADASTVSTLEPVTTILLAALFLDEFIRPQQFLGGAIILGAVIVLVRCGVPAAPRGLAASGGE